MENAPLKGNPLVFGTIALSLATFMNVLDTSIANVSLPAIAGDLGVSPEQGTWVITSFAVANAISLPLTGWLTQRFGQVRLFSASVVLFVLASLACGLAPSIEMLIFFRIVQGFVAGPMIPLSQTLLLASYPKEKAGTALALWSITTLVAPVAGPLLGGWITDNLSWPWIFYINVPVGIAAAAVTWMIYAKRETPTRRIPIDGVGLGLLVVWVGALQVMLDKGKDLDWFASGTIVALAVAAALAFALFVAWELTEEHPVVDLRLFKRRNFTMGVISLTLAYGVFFGNLVLLPMWLQQYMGYTATLAGMALAPVGLLAIILSPVVGRNVSKVDVRILSTISFAIFAVVMYLRARFNAQVDFETVMIPTIVQGAAVAFFFIPLVTLTLSGIAPAQLPAASGLSNFARITGGAFGTSISTTLMDHRATLHHAQLAEKLTTYDPVTTQALAAMQAGGMTPEQSVGALNQMVNQQAAVLSVTDIFYASAIIFVLLIGVVWLAKPIGSGAASAEVSGAH